MREHLSNAKLRYYTKCDTEHVSESKIKMILNYIKLFKEGIYFDNRLKQFENHKKENQKFES